MEDFVNRRLLLAKEFYVNAMDLCNHSDSLSKMIAVHNLHIAIEITLKAILLKFEIRSEKTLNINFETMLSNIDRHSAFKSEGKSLPYRQEVRNLNQMRNMVQHHAMEPDQNPMEDWKVITRRFLEKTFSLYFDEDFQRISRVSFIADELLQSYMEKALSLVVDSKYFPSACFAVTAFEYAETSLHKFVPRSELSFSGFSTRRRSALDLREVEDVLKKIDKRVDESFFYSTVFGTGITLSDYKRFRGTVPSVMLAIQGYPNFFPWSNEGYSQDEASWACAFVIDCIIKWQSQGLSPMVPENLVKGAVQFLHEGIAEKDP